MTIPNDLVELGRIVGAHGIQGWIKIQPFSSDSDVLHSAKRWWLGKNQGPLAGTSAKTIIQDSIQIVWAKPHGSTWLARVKSLEDRDSAEALKGMTVLVPRSVFPPLPENEFYWIDLIGCHVTTNEQGVVEPLGVVESMQDNPAHAILVVRQQVRDVNGHWTDRLNDKGQSVYSLIPFVAAHILSVDLNDRVIQTNWPQDF